MTQARKNTRHGTLADSLKAAMKVALKDSSGTIAAYGDALSFRKSILQTGLFEVDVNLRPTFGSRIQLTGDAHQGKSLLSYILMAAAQRTCRQCFTPIIDFVQDWTGEVVTTCRCGKNDGMRVLLINAENDFDPAWASRWGVRIPHDVATGSSVTADGFCIAEDSSFVLVRGGAGESVRTVTTQLVRDGAVDLIVIDSIAVLEPASRREGKSMIGDQAKMVTGLVTSLIAAQGEAANQDGIAPTILMINQYRVKIGGFSPHGTPKEAAGGWALKYSNSISWDLRSVYNARDMTMRHKFADCVLTAKKDKESGGTNTSAEYRLYLDDIDIKGIPYTVGQTDEGSRIYSFLKELGSLDSRWFEKKGNKYVIFEREFTKVADIARFLSRRDIGHLLRFPIYAQKFPPTLRAHLTTEAYDYTPFRDEPILALYEEATKQLGSLVQQRPDSLEPVMLRDGSDKKARTLSDEDVAELLDN